MDYSSPGRWINKAPHRTEDAFEPERDYTVGSCIPLAADVAISTSNWRSPFVNEAGDKIIGMPSLTGAFGELAVEAALARLTLVVARKRFDDAQKSVNKALAAKIKAENKLNSAINAEAENLD